MRNIPQFKSFSHNTFHRHVWDKFGNYNALENLVQDKFKTFYCWLILNVTKQQTCVGQVWKICSSEVSKLHNIFAYVMSQMQLLLQFLVKMFRISIWFLLQANGFLGASGIAGSIPSVYTLVARRFYQRTRDLVQRHRVHISEYQRSGWTFHGKGLWYYLPGHTLPILTLIGSPNFGKSCFILPKRTVHYSENIRFFKYLSCTCKTCLGQTPHGPWISVRGWQDGLKKEGEMY